MTDNTLYRKLFESSNAPILIINADFQFIECNEMASKLLQMPRNEIIGKTPVGISPKHQNDGRLSADLGRAYFTAAMEGKDQIFEWTHLTSKGSEFIVEVSLFGFDASGKEHFFVMWRDLTEIRKNEKELKESIERFKTLFSKSTDGIVLHAADLVSGIIDCNDAALNILEYTSKDELLGKSVLEISPEYQDDGNKSSVLGAKYIQQCLENDRTRFEWTHLKKDKTPVCFDIVLTKISFQSETIIYAIWRDITEKKRQQEELDNYRNRLEELIEEKTTELKNAQGQLIQAEKMVTVGTLTAGIAHEINNPLNYMKGAYLGLNHDLKDLVNEKPDVKAYLEAIEIGVDRIANIVRGLNQLSRHNEDYDEDCDIHSILDNCLAILLNRYKNRIEIKK